MKRALNDSALHGDTPCAIGQNRNEFINSTSYRFVSDRNSAQAILSSLAQLEFLLVLHNWRPT
eukprot:3072600-Amphidinium_carterae.1